MDRIQALKIVEEFVKNRGLINHMLCVEAAMRWYAETLDQDVETWGLAGLLHDFDWEIHPTMEEHPTAGAPILRERGVSEEVVQAILSHGVETGVPRDTLMRKALYACDEITGLITAVALVRPSKSLYDLKAKSVKKKWKDRSFAAGANREEIAEGAEAFEVELWQHTTNVIMAMRSIAPEIGLAGNLSPDGIPLDA
ncbi:MAG: HDIG domain-containing protein [Anaerolineaceae bacterium]|jgi:putative nucleotidyltransferase with HDIG domain|nr:HDIG domain-containing protein [Anaerolineaceae bacterium]